MCIFIKQTIYIMESILLLLKKNLKLPNFKQFVIFTGLLALIFTINSCDKENLEVDLDRIITPLGLEALPGVSHPANNASSQDKVDLGKFLFWDPIIGGEKDVACATCHHPNHGYSDGLDLPIGVNGTGLGATRTENSGGLGLTIERVGRNSPSVLNTAYNGMTSLGAYSPENAPMFWDSRMLSLEAQCQGPPTSRSEMRGDAYPEELTFDSIIIRLAAIPEYVALFDAAFGGGATAITQENYAKALGAFERTIVTDNSPYIQYLNGQTEALTDQEKEGLLLFFGKANCSACHSGPMLSDFNFHAIGIPDNPSFPGDTDVGKDGLYKFRTPTLHNVSLTGPYMHNGMITTLREVVEFMNKGVSENSNVLSGMIDSDFKPLSLTSDEIDNIVAFLKSLTDNDFDKTPPPSVPSGLSVGGNIE